MESVQPGLWAGDAWQPKTPQRLEDVSTLLSSATQLPDSPLVPLPPGLGSAAGWPSAWDALRLPEPRASAARPAPAPVPVVLAAEYPSSSCSSRVTAGGVAAATSRDTASTAAGESGSPRYVHLPSDGQGGVAGATDLDVAYVGVQRAGGRKRNRRPRHGKSPPGQAPVKVAVEHLAQVALMSRLEASDEVWSRCAERRESDVNVVKNFREYQLYLGEVPRGGRRDDDPHTPDHTDRSKSKRCWKREVGDWRAAVMGRRASSSSDTAAPQDVAAEPPGFGSADG